jgi:hypothetical protein
MPNKNPEEEMAFRSKGEERNEPVAGIKWGDNEGAELYAASGESGDAKRRKNAGCEAVMAAIVSRRLLILFSSSSFPSLPAHRPPQHPSKLLPLRQPPHDSDIHALSLSLSLSPSLLDPCHFVAPNRAPRNVTLTLRLSPSLPPSLALKFLSIDQMACFWFVPFSLLSFEKLPPFQPLITRFRVSVGTYVPPKHGLPIL